MSDKPLDADGLVKFMDGESPEPTGLPAVLASVGGLALALGAAGLAALAVAGSLPTMLALYASKEIQGRPPLPPEAD